MTPLQKDAGPSTFNPIPLVLGVVGQRDLRGVDPKALTDTVAECLKQFPCDYPHTPVLLLTSLAQGGEQLVVTVAQDGLKDRAQLVVVRPFPTTSPPGSAMRVLTLLGDTDPAGAALADADLRREMARTFVARNCQILIAVGDRPGEVGAAIDFKRTGQLRNDVRAGLERMPEPFGLTEGPLEAPETGPVYHIPLPRPGEALPEVKPIHQLAPAAYDDSAAARVEYFRQLRRITRNRLDRFNADARKLVRTGDWSKSRGYLPQADEDGGAPTSLRALGDTFATADVLASRHQAHVQQALKWSLLLIFLAVVAFGVAAHVLTLELKYGALAAYLLFLVAALGFFLVRFGVQQCQKLHQDYRTLAEGLRVQFYLRLAGLGASVSEYYLSKQKNELEWIRNAVRARAILAEPSPVPQVDVIRQHWIKGQVEYYIDRSLRNRARTLLFAYLVRGFLFASLLTSAAVVAVSWHLYRHGWRVGLAVGGLAAFGLTVVACHIILRWEEAREEFREDREEVAQAKHELGRMIPGLELPKKVPDMVRSAASGFLVGLLLGLLLTFGLAGIAAAAEKHIRVAAAAEKHIPEREEATVHQAGDGGSDDEAERRTREQEKAAHHDPAADHSRRAALPWIEYYGGGSLITATLLVAMGWSVALATLCQWYSEKSAFAELHKQYKRMRLIFARAYCCIEDHTKNNKTDAAVATVAVLGREALAEHAEWLLLHRERPGELPRLEI
jgi:hypothetical protein